VSKHREIVDLVPIVMTVTAKATVVEYRSKVPSKKNKEKVAGELLHDGRATVVQIGEAESDIGGEESGQSHLVWKAAWVHDKTSARPRIPNFEFSRN
jgi:hypothetical protein